jgi:lipopolysaccharide transport system ATP-binding protein
MLDTKIPKGPENEVVVSASGLKKAYRVWKDPSGRLKAPLFDAFGRLIPKALRPKSLKKRLSHKGTSPYYTDYYALKGIDLEIKRGDTVGIIGRNGSGKSTLLQILAGTLTPTEGTIKVKGRIAALLELGSGFNPEFSGRENVYLNASVLGLKRQQIDSKMEDILAFADIGDFIDQPVKTYSSGMNMRLAFAVIAHVDADVLIVDEALAVGDVFFVQKCMRFIRKFQQTGTLIIVTHDTGAVQSLCKEAIWLHQGEFKGKGSAKKMTELYLETTYASKQGAKLFEPRSNTRLPQAPKSQNEKITQADQRSDHINSGNLRNDMKVFKFDPDSPSFGEKGATIEDVLLLDSKTNDNLIYCVGGENVTLEVKVTAICDLSSPIVGFQFKNNYGQIVFGDNTYITHSDNPAKCMAGGQFVASFQFQMPYLPPGDYVITVAVANGTQEDHENHHWLHDALSIKVEHSHVCHGLVGIPMQNIEIRNL